MKGGTQPIILMAHLAVAWLCLASSAALLPALSSENADAVVLKTEYIKLNFSTASATPETYKSLIASVRAGLVSKAGGSSSGIPVLVDEDDPLALEAFLNITLVNKAGRSVSLKMDVARASFIAYDAGNYSCLLKRSAGTGTVSSAICYSDPWGSRRSWAVVTPPRSSSSTGSGDDLEVATTWRLEDLDAAVSSLYLFPTGNATAEDLGRGAAACDMMVASAAAFPYIERRMSAGMWDGNGVADDPSLRGLAARWPWLSFAVQQSYQGAFAAPVPVQRSNGEWMRVDSVRRAVPLVSFLAHDTCNRSSSSSSRLPSLIRSVVQEPEDGGGAPATPCGEDEPTVRLAGPEGRCVDVPYGNYKNGKQVQLWSCKSAGDVNQLWTLKRDGTIRSNGKCLASSGGAAGARVVVDECPPAAPTTARAVWEVRADGTVALKGGLVLAVTSSRLMAGLTVRADDRGTGQSWTPTNDTAPMAAAIVGFRDLCLQVSYAGAVTVAACGGGAGGVQWSLYPDGSVRPPAWLFLQWQCLAADASGRVTVGYCDGAGSACERWVFRSDGTILNTGTGKVLDVRACGSKQDCWEVIVSNASDGSPSPTQKWALML